MVGNVRTGGEDGSSPKQPDGSGGDSSTVKTGQDGTGTTSAEPVKKTAFELDIKNNKKATDQFDYKKDGKTVTYTAKDNYAFNVVKDDKTEIWRTDKETEYASKVVLNGKGQKEKIVTIYLPNNTTKSYKKDGKNNPWNEYTGELPSTGNAKSSNVSGFELNIKSEVIESNDNFHVEKSYIGNLYIITFKRGVTCSLVKVDDKEVWKYDSSKSKHCYPRNVTYYKEDKRVRINFDHNNLEYNKSGDNWQLKEAPKESSTDSTTGKTGTGTGGGGATPAS
ncbi:hypothetical protein MACJ_003904 [Theileria orientalis]|uniref:Uncharacterized protein n=1 Tax=Theileria orientalis TaxID=68886 RepID=A0A976SKT9_THEOR|nr:hypothetical protein MACJ_003904 [Theileria orientalis]